MRELDPDVVEHDYSKQTPDPADLKRILAHLSVEEILNTRQKVAKEKGWKEKAPAKAAFIAAAVEEPNLLKRPIVLTRKTAYVGRSLDAIRALLT